MHTPRLIYIWQWGIVAVRDQVAHFRTPLQQLIQCAHILNVPVLQHNDLVCPVQRRQPM